MRLVFINPHVQPLVSPVYPWLMRQHSIDKYRYIVDEIIKNPDRLVAFVVDGTKTSFSSLGINLWLWPRMLGRIECWCWMKIHGINARGIKVYSSVKELDEKNDVLFVFARGQLNSEKDISGEIYKFRGLWLVQMTHYIVGVKEIAKKLKKIQYPLVLAESNLARHNKFFRHWFPAIQLVYTLPFVVKERYWQSEESFLNRQNKCFAIGTFFDADSYSEYKDFFGDKPFHLMRKIIYEKQGELLDVIDSYISEAKKSEAIRQGERQDNLWVIILKRHAPYFLLERFIRSHRRDYYKFDIVEKYNEYRMFISPEETIGLPSINVLEGMACGCAYLGIDTPIYSDIGMRAGQHFVSYKEGDLGDLIEKIRYYQAHPEELEMIAKAGKSFADGFNGKRVAGMWWGDVNRAAQEFGQNGTVKFTSLFVEGS